MGGRGASGNTLRATNEQMSTEQLERMRKNLESIRDQSYWIFTRQAHNKAKGALQRDSEASEQLRMIKQILKRRRRNK